MTKSFVLDLHFARAAAKGDVREWWANDLPENMERGDSVWFRDRRNHEVLGGASVEYVKRLKPEDYELFARRHWRNAQISYDEYMALLKAAPPQNGLIRLREPYMCRPVCWEDAENGGEVPAEMLARLQYSRLDVYRGEKRTIPRVLDACCGSRMMWYDKRDSRAVFMDIRSESHVLCDGRELVINPDVVADFRDMPFPPGVFELVTFDPPHLLHAGESSWLRTKYGVLSRSWKDDLMRGFRECWRVLAPGGTLVFKWSEEQVAISCVLPLAPAKPMFGHRRGKTMFIVFYKPREEAQHE